jgi:hypothetical protein
MELAVFETLPSLACSTNLPSVEVWDFVWARNSGWCFNTCELGDIHRQLQQILIQN